MFEVLVFVYENYWRGDACPEPRHLGRRLSAAGFEPAEIAEALTWLDGLNVAAQSLGAAAKASGAAASQSAAAAGAAPQPYAETAQSPGAMRIYSAREQDALGAECLGFISFLESSGVLAPALREIVLDRAVAAAAGQGEALALDALKIIVLMVYWRFGEEPDALVLDELCDDSEGRVAH